MSVLSYPRVYFHGHMAWDVCTANNNDYVPTYDFAHAALDWEYLATKGITPENFRDEFRKWVVKPNSDTCPPADPGDPTVDNCGPDGQRNPTCHMSSRWGYYGGGGCWFVQYKDFTTTTVGGVLAAGQPATSNDALIGQPMVIQGNTFGGRQSAARLVDINPSAPWCSQIYFQSLQAGTQNGGTYIGGPGADRMYSRSFMVPRNVSSDLIIAGAIGVVFQSTIPKDKVVSGNAGNSPLLQTLLAALNQPEVAGLMVRFSAYNTLYYQNETFNDYPAAPDCDTLTRLWQEGQIFPNPAYSLVTGTIGLWQQGELVNAPGGPVLVPNAVLTPVTPPASGNFSGVAQVSMAGHGDVQFQARSAASQDTASPGPPLGSAWAQVDTAGRVASIDLINAIPENTVEGTKFDFGPLTLGVQVGQGFHPLGTFPFADYDRAAYNQHGGIVDVPFGQGLSPEDAGQLTPENVESWLAQGQIALHGQGQNALLESVLTAETDQRGVYIDQCHTEAITVQVREGGGLPNRPARLKLAQYYPWPLIVGAGQWQLFGTTPTASGSGEPSMESEFCKVLPQGPYVQFADGDDMPVVNGEALVRLRANLPGLPVVVFFPYFEGDSAPTPPATVNFGFNGPGAASIDTAFYAAVRVMPFDNDLPAEFVHRWNGTGPYQGEPKYDRTLAWLFIYNKILYVYDMLYPVMDQFMPLGDLTRVEGAIDQLLILIQEEFEPASTLYMPVTRELSAGKRLVLQAWGNLVQRKYPPVDIGPIEVPCD